MANRPGRRRFGYVRKLPSGRYQASYLGPDGRRRSAPETFERKKDADVYLSRVEALMSRDEWTDPARAKVRLGDYAERWIDERAGLRPRTVELYRWLLGKYITPYLGSTPLGSVSTAAVREWRAALLTSGVSDTMAAKSYRLLRAILNTAVDEDRILPRNPCRVRGADKETPAERPVLTVAQVFELADAMRYRRLRALILVAAFTSLRWGEATALRRCDIAPDASWVRVAVAHTEVAGRGIVVGPPKSRAGLRTVAVPSAIRADIVKHLMLYVDSDPGALVFTGPKGGALRRAHFNNLTRWVETVRGLGVPGLHFHDLRHTGNHLAARTGATTKDLMTRMGHDDMRAALIYQHATGEADRQIAERLSDLVDEHQQQGRPDDDDDGAAGALVPVG